MRLLTLGLIGAAQPVAADPVAAFGQWAAEQGAEQTAIAVVRDGAVLFQDHADVPSDLASNSKAITALCVAALVSDGRLDWNMTLTEALGQPAPDGTLADLVTHSAGIAPDSTQLRMGFWRNETEPRHAHVTQIVLDRRRQRGTRGEFRYNNENYALLGRIIELAAEAPYEQTCRRLVLEPAGVDGALSPRFGGFAGWGGWRMTMADHARLIAYWFGPDGPFGAEPQTAPYIARGEGRYYGLGMNYLRQEGGVQMSHAGGIAIPFGPKTGAYVVRFPDGTVAATAYDVAVARLGKFRALDRVLAEALFSAGADKKDTQ